MVRHLREITTYLVNHIVKRKETTKGHKVRGKRTKIQEHPNLLKFRILVTSRCQMMKMTSVFALRGLKSNKEITSTLSVQKNLLQDYRKQWKTSLDRNGDPFETMLTQKKNGTMQAHSCILMQIFSVK